MPARSHGKKYNTAKRQPTARAVPASNNPETPENLPAAVATAARPMVRSTPVPGTQPAPRRNYLGKELRRVLIVSAIVLAILLILALVLR